ncbi:ABC transporter permease [Marinisporobacter balticus]|uniref:Peptide/nickel transport system permease protein n=1 Tax=Marinisporobacter balticus TaxID=2018667 RepID=A0A4R2K9E8_9FIRM|nr:ABC transporter permease [Marinisporobacter balticus]TCO69344.1 peptide/nickel transport system permease protein [Marinisporobacter balticus]
MREKVEVINTDLKKKKEDLKKKAKKRSQIADVWKRLKKSPAAVIGIILIIIFILMAVFANYIADYQTDAIKMNVVNRLQSPNKDHWFGTDEFGRDIFARIVYGTRISLFVGLISVGIALTIGGTLGAIAGYYGGKIDNMIMRVLDVLLAIPTILLAITIVAALGASIMNLMIAVGISNIPGFARVVRASVLSVKDQEFIEAAKAIGARDHTIILKHVLPNSMAPIIVYATLKVATAIMATASLSFIGLGVAPPTPEWGSMLAGGRNYMRDSMHIVMFPGLAIVLTVLSLNLIGDGLRDALDPKLK